MATQKPDHSDNIEECKSIFPTYQWAIGVITGFIVVSVTCAIIYAKQETTQEFMLKDIDAKTTLNTQDIKDHNFRIAKLESMSNNLDTIKTLIRSHSWSK